MTKEKEVFIKIIQKEIFDRPDIYGENYDEDFPIALAYFEKLKTESDNKLTENGKKVLAFLQSREKNDPICSALIGEGLFISSRSVSGTIQKLVKMGLVDKYDTKPISYALTEIGQKCKID